MCRLGGLQQRHPSPDIASTQTESPAGWQGFLFALHADELCRQGRHVSFRLAQAHRRLTQIQSKQASVERARGAGDARIVRLGHYLFVAEGEDGRSSMDTARLGIAASLFTRGCGKGKEWRELGVRRHGTPHSKGLGFGLRGRTVEKYRSQVDAQKVYQVALHQGVCTCGFLPGIHWIHPASASRSFCQVTSIGSGRTRVSAVVVMKLVSPIQRGSACRCRCSATPAPAARPRLRPKFRPSG